jgi:hypothetical protein
MNGLRRFAASAALLLSTGLYAHAQYLPPSQPPVAGAQPPGAVLVLSSFATAHDSLQHRVARIRAQAAARQSSFKTVQGTLGGLHRTVKTYAGVPQGVVNAVGFQMASLVVKEQTIKHRYGIELEKVVYRDAKGRKVLTERYEGHQLMRLEVLEYGDLLSAPSGRWLLVHGDYLRYSSAPTNLAYKGKEQQSYFFRPSPAGE